MSEILKLPQGGTLSVLPRGGAYFVQPCQQIQPTDLSALKACARQWPQENGPVVDAILQNFQKFPEQEQWLACESAFFAHLPQAAASYALPTAEAAGYHLFGADGLMHAWAAARHQQLSKIISVNLAANTSLAAIQDGKAIDCSNGYSLLSGLPGLTTCGQIDPSLIFSMAEQGQTATQIREMLYEQSGWQAIGQTSLTFQSFLSDASPRLEMARSMFTQGLIKQIGAMLSALGGAERVILMCRSAAICEPLGQRIRCHFQPYNLNIELVEVSRNEVMLNLIQTGQNQNKG
jgi:acetate kinase